jgi:hypothetical protein
LYVEKMQLDVQFFSYAFIFEMQHVKIQTANCLSEKKYGVRP